MVRIIKSLIMPWACFILLTGFCSEVPEMDKSLTILVYMTGSDLETLNGEAGTDLEEMVHAAPDGAVTVAVLTGGAAQWQNDIPSDQNTLWQVSPQGLVEVERYSDRSLGDPNVLSDFLKRGTELFPAENYALILWDHGAGPLNGVCFDERHGMDSLALKELQSALEDSPFSQNPLMFIGFDACLMASAEVAEAVAPYAELMVASQEPEPASGWDYTFLSGIGKACDGFEACRMIVDSYAESLRDKRNPATLSCIQLSKIPTLHEAMDELFGKLSEQVDSDNYALLASSRNNTKVLGAATPMAWDLVDLRDLCDMLEETGMADATGLKKVLDEAVVYSWANESYVNGLSIYSPFNNKNKYTYPWASRYRSLDFSQNYRTYIQSFAGEWMGQSRVSWNDEAEVQLETYNQRQWIKTELTDVESADVAGARLLVLEEQSEGQYRLLYASGSLQPVGGKLSAVYNSEALYMLDDAGNILCGPLELIPLENGLATFGLMEKGLNEVFGLYITWQQDENGQFEPNGYYIYNEEQDIYTSIANPLTPGADLNFGLHARCLPEKDAPYSQWPFGTAIRFNHVVYTGETEWHLKFLPAQSKRNRVALYEITDLQANTHLTSMIPLENTAGLEVLDAPQTVEASSMELSLTDAVLYSGPDSGLQLDFTLRGDLPDDVTANVNTVMLDDTVLLNLYTPKRVKASHEGTHFRVWIDARELQRNRINYISKIRLYLGEAENTTRLATARFAFDLPVDLSMIVQPVRKSPEPAAVFEQDGVRFELLGFSNDPYGDLICEMHLENCSGIEKTIDFSDGSVNGLYPYFSIPKGTGPYLLPPDSESRFPFRFSEPLIPNEDWGKKFPVEISDIRNIGFCMQQETDISLEMRSLCPQTGEIEDDQVPAHSEKVPAQLLVLTNTPQKAESESGFSLTLTEASLEKGTNDALLMNFTLQGGWGEETRADVDTVTLDDTALWTLSLPKYLDLSDGKAQMTVKIDAEHLRYNHITHVGQVSLYMKMYDINQKKAYARFDFDLPADLSTIASSQSEPSKPVAAFEQDGLYFELLALSDDGHGGIVCDLHVENRSDTSRCISDIQGEVNGMHLDSKIQPFVFFNPFVLPPNGESRFSMLFYETDPETNEPTGQFPCKISDIRNISLRVNQKAAITFVERGTVPMSFSQYSIYCPVPQSS